MLGWAIGFFLAAVVAAVFGFSGIASAFAGIAVILFWVFVALFVLSLIFGLFGARAVAHDHTPGHTTSGFGGRTFATVAVAAIVALLVYAWSDNNMSAERVGAEIDDTAVELAEATSDALRGAGDRAENLMEETSDEIRNDAAAGLDEASDTVESNEDDSST